MLFACTHHKGSPAAWFAVPQWNALGDPRWCKLTWLLRESIHMMPWDRSQTQASIATLRTVTVPNPEYERNDLVTARTFRHPQALTGVDGNRIGACPARAEHADGGDRIQIGDSFIGRAAPIEIAVAIRDGRTAAEVHRAAWNETM